MEVKKVHNYLDKLYHYGETIYVAELQPFVDRGLLYVYEKKAIITNNWIEFVKRFPNKDDFLHTLFCFDEAYQNYLLQTALLTVLKMREAEDIDGIIDFVYKMPKVARKVVNLLDEIKSGDRYDITLLEQRVKKSEPSFRERNHFIFNGVPYYQRLIYYVHHIQQYEEQAIGQDVPLGKKIDEQWAKGRKIGSDLQLLPGKNRPFAILTPYEPAIEFANPLFKHLLTYPWKLFVFLCCVVREQTEAQGKATIRFHAVNDQVDVILMSSKNQEYRYGTVDEFALEFCKINNYQLFPAESNRLATVFHNLHDRGFLTIVDEEYRIPTHIEDELYNTSLFIPLIAGSKQVRKRIEQWIDELRDRG
jgi:esterase/lipase superfamily enzyme